MSTLKEQLIKERTKRNKTRKEIADHLGVVVNTYGKYERGERIPDIETLIKIADYYQISLDILSGRYN